MFEKHYTDCIWWEFTMLFWIKKIHWLSIWKCFLTMKIIFKNPKIFKVSTSFAENSPSVRFNKQWVSSAASEGPTVVPKGTHNKNNARKSAYCTARRTLAHIQHNRHELIWEEYMLQSGRLSKIVRTSAELICNYNLHLHRRVHTLTRNPRL